MEWRSLANLTLATWQSVTMKRTLTTTTAGCLGMLFPMQIVATSTPGSTSQWRVFQQARLSLSPSRVWHVRENYTRWVWGQSLGLLQARWSGRDPQAVWNGIMRRTSTSQSHSLTPLTISRIEMWPTSHGPIHTHSKSLWRRHRSYSRSIRTMSRSTCTEKFFTTVESVGQWNW